MENYGSEDYYGGARPQPDPGFRPGVAVRPVVDPDAEGEVDPSQYPQPKEATHKIRGKSDFLELIFGTVDQELLMVKTFYFFFYSAFGSLFPLMGVYFKQMGMNAGQCGFLIGLRPFIEFLSAPFWGSLADRWQKGKVILLASLSCWIIFTLPLGFIQPPATSCVLRYNHTSYLGIPDLDLRIVKRSVGQQLYKIATDMNDLEVAKNVVFEGQYINSIYHINNHINKSKFASDISKPNGVYANRETYPYSTISSKESVTRTVAPKDIDYNDTQKPTKTKLYQEKSRRKLYPIKSNEEEASVADEEKASAATMTPSRKYETNVGNLRRLMDSDYSDYDESEETHIRHRRSVKLPVPSTGQSPLPVSYTVNYNEKEHSSWVKPLFSSIVYRLSDIQKTFFLLLLLVIVGEFFSAPAITLADSAVITILGEDADKYGHQRMFGSLGWGLAMFFVGIALDHSTSFPDHPCGGPDPREKNYTICFAIFSVLMGAALITATQINFKYDVPPPEPQEEVKQNVELTREEQFQNQLSQQLNLPGLQDTSAALPPPTKKQEPPEGQTKIFAQTLREIPEWVTVVKHFKDVKCASFLFVAWFMGFGIGLIFTFLFWHLQDYGGSPTLFGVASVINHISEIFAYFFSFLLIQQIGHVKVLCLGLVGNVIRFLYISWLKNPWWVLPFEFMQGITHAAVWAACCSYIAHNTPPQLRSSAQGVLQGLHHGLGRGCGAVIGGIFVAYYGTTAVFRAYGLLCLVVLGVFIFINFYRKDTGFVSDLPQTEDPRQVAEATHLAPHGVPSNAIPRALSSSRLHELANQDAGYGATYQTTGGNLNVPGGNGRG